MSDTIAPTEFQSRVLAYRGHCNVLNAGGRGSGKSLAMILDLLDHCRSSWASALVLRESWGGLQELEDRVFELGFAAFGRRTKRNRQEGTVRMGSGAVVTFSNVGDDQSYAKLHGRTFTALYADELGNYTPAGFDLFRRCMSNLRAPEGRRTHVHATANPHGRSHGRILREFVRGREPWRPFADGAGELWIWTTSTLRDNPHIDRDAYERRLRSSTSGDAELARAWIEGDWSVLGGVMFDVFSPARHVVASAPEVVPRRYRMLIGADWGTASPSTGLLLGQLRDPVGHFRPGDLFVLDEVDTAIPGDLSQGNGMSVPAWADELRALWVRNRGDGSPRVVTDDMRGLHGDTVVRELQHCGIAAQRPWRKDRVGTWALLRSVLQSARERDGRPGLWITERCVHLLETLPEAPRSPSRAEDIDPRFDRDHWLDGLGYALQELHGVGPVTSGRTVGLW